MTELPSYTPGWPADWNLIPGYMVGGLRRYIENGIYPGSFLFAVLSNDLRGAIERADEINAHALKNYVTFLYMSAPSECWGSREKVVAWLEQRGLGLKEVCRS